MQWPIVVASAFAIGRYVARLEVRIAGAEKNIKDLVDRHLPHVHSALMDIKEGLAVVRGAVTGRRN